MEMENTEKNLGGRPRGAVSLGTVEKRNLIEFLKEKGADRFLDIMEKMDDKEFADKYLKLIEFAFPKSKQLLEHSGPGGFPLPQAVVNLTITDKRAMELKDRFEEELKKEIMG